MSVARLKDHAQTWRDDMRTWPAEIVIRHAEAHLAALQELPAGTEDRDAAIADMVRFLEKYAVV